MQLPITLEYQVLEYVYPWQKQKWHAGYSSRTQL